MKLVLTCEHGGNNIPKVYAPYFKHHKAVLNTHRGYDIGALDLFNYLKPLANASKHNETSRLLIELNRSLHHKKLFSDYSKTLSKTEKEVLISDYYLDYRNDVESTIKNYIKSGHTVLHVSVHSFTPILNGEERNCDIGLLYDSRKTEESDFSKLFKKKLLQADTTLKIRFNYPYLGKADGFSTYLRKQFPNNYLGIELEINQKHAKNNCIDSKIKTNLVTALQSLLN